MATGSIPDYNTYFPPNLIPRVTNRSSQCFVQGLPPQRDVGYVTKDTFFIMYLWNGSATDGVLTSITEDDGAEGITWDSTVPIVIHSNESLRIIITVSIDGPLAFTGLLTFVSSCNTIIFTVTGTRAPHLSGDTGYIFLPHNWENGLDETLTWKTDVMIAYDRTEQRMQLRDIPRRSWDIQLIAEGDFRRKLEAYLTMRITKYLFTPIWRDATPLLEDVIPGGSVVTIQDYSDNYVKDSMFAIWQDENTFEIRTIQSVGANFIAVDSPFLNSWTAGISYMGPCRSFTGATSRKSNRETYDASVFNITTVALDDLWKPYYSPAIDTIYGYEICPFEASFENGDETWDNKWVVLDNDIGVIEYDIQSQEPVISREAKFVVSSKDSINKFFQFISDIAGQLVPFWLPSTDKSFRLTLPSLAGTNTITIAYIGYAYEFTGCNCRSYIELETYSGTIIRAKINSVEVLPTLDEQLTLDISLPVDIADNTLIRCSWFELVRANSDEVKIHWETNTCIDVTLPVVTLP